MSAAKANFCRTASRESQSVHMTVEITPFTRKFQQAVEDLILPIQKEEFEFDLPREEQPDLIDIPGVFQIGNGNFWIALDGRKVVGTIGVIDLADQQVALKKMFVAREYRGKDVAQMLMSTAVKWCASRKVEKIFLATNDKMTVAQKFYKKNGFIEINKSELPSAFPITPVATNFYRRVITTRLR